MPLVKMMLFNSHENYRKWGKKQGKKRPFAPLRRGDKNLSPDMGDGSTERSQERLFPRFNNTIDGSGFHNSGYIITPGFTFRLARIDGHQQKKAGFESRLPLRSAARMPRVITTFWR
jgi:hypothetical protein